MSPGIAVTDLLAGMAEPSVILEGTVTGLAIDSRCVEGGELFLAYPGVRLDGRSFIDEALNRGAAAVAFEPERFEFANRRVSGIPVAGLSARVSEIAARFYARPSGELCVIGVTGTNGKTSCVHFLSQSLERLGEKVRMIGTLGSGVVWRPRTNGLTTPSPLDLQKQLRQFVNDGAAYVVMEVSSHALKQGRISAVDFDVALFTNLTRDHLDYHADIDDYAGAKKSLFERASLRLAVVNVDDPVGRQIREESTAPVASFGEQGVFGPGAVRIEETGLTIRVTNPYRAIKVSVALLGRVNVANVLAVAATLLAMGFDPADVEKALNQLSPVPGRMELFRSPRGGPTAVVDYAHTPDALEQALRSVREHCRGELWCVFGCGGDRDRGKRPKMGRIAEQYAERVVLTNDNPRGEPPDRIVAEIRDGMHRGPDVVLDRGTAIAGALEAACPDDWVLIAGKGHETSQVIDEKVMPFDDREVVSGCLGKAA
ncbi:MAG: UDP-N-acetylmuramoyl-L-alanyl-D-glutamate--2,6-diaminopimelate ligase [Gammaproteobacteria bacterium]|nr:UDP-N-acetylmuramoyl-L-alanyl-D-glutamate--2,6-diaminopimelate ligase [Gammaproteobacteria bacterium]